VLNNSYNSIKDRNSLKAIVVLHIQRGKMKIHLINFILSFFENKIKKNKKLILYSLLDALFTFVLQEKKI